ncbi:hypothetical protein PR202_gb29328 [Eleusine coracana subsp. coracana]|uniref:Plant-specific domain TIGR01615 family protein n=1 Tax=Eleusine coracana subsp. coracana TaxID=191504 RepID=A0AAV5G085_ELECO|nr:hypothetical protein QOZ80_9BG0706350 [Eleusine coracana subsp. coracana]GJN40150.1 hypothetical protein PR202_gb29328 [Eleusine coracana subsp. coracana]
MSEVTACCVGAGRWCDGSSLSSLVHDFFGVGSGSRSTKELDAGYGNADAESSARDSGVKPSSSDVADKATKAAKRVTTLLHKSMAADPFLQLLAGDIAKAVEEMVSLQSSWPLFRRAVASRLVEGGYDAAVCQTRWRATEDVTSGNYEYIDVVTPASGKAVASSERYIVDIGFAKEFVVARPTAAYTTVLDALPGVLVAPPKVVQQVVKVAAKAARRSLKSQGLTVPPWRKKRFMVAKWLGPYNRTPDTAMEPRVAAAAAREAMRQIVGFVLGPSVSPSLSYARL